MLKTSLEIGHIYGKNNPFGFFSGTKNTDFNKIMNNNFVYEVKVGKKIHDFLLGLKIQNKIIWFYDDVESRIKGQTNDMIFLQIARNQAISYIKENIYFASLEVQNEYDLIDQARDSISSIKSVILSKKWTINKENTTIENKDGSREIKLFGYKNHPQMPSCESLDFTFYKKRISSVDVTISLIHISMKDQQNRVRDLFEIIGKKPEIIVLYYSGEYICELEYWGKRKDFTLLKLILDELNK